jgi:Peptidase S46
LALLPKTLSVSEPAKAVLQPLGIVSAHPRSWVHAWWLHFAESFRGTLTVLGTLARHPITLGRSFSAACAAGAEVTNPLTVFGMAIGLLSPAILWCKHAMGVGHSKPLAMLAHHFEPYLNFVVLGLLAHACLILLRASSSAWFTTLGLAFYASAFASLADLVAAVLAMSLTLSSDLPDVFQTAAAIIGAAVSSVYLALFALSVIGAHRATPVRAAAAVSLFDGQNESFSLPETWRSKKADVDLGMTFSVLTDLDTLSTKGSHQEDTGGGAVDAQGRYVGMVSGGTPSRSVAMHVFDPATTRTSLVTSEAILHILRNIYDAQALVKELTGEALASSR